MGLILRTTLTPNSGNSLSIKGTALSYVEGDGNFMYLLTNMSGSNISITGSTGILGSTTMRGTSTISNPANTTSFTIIDNGTTTASDTVMQFTSSLNGFRHIKGTNSGSGSGAAVGAIFYNNNNDFLQIYQACTLNSSLNGARAAHIRSTGTSLSLMADNTSGNIRFFTFNNTSERMRITSAGYVGIGTTSPAVELDVNGSIKAAGYVNSNALYTDIIAGGANTYINLTQDTAVTGYLSATDVLTLPPQNPLPSGKPTGSFAVSGSGANCKPYFYNGTSWTALF
jgi:hypothetical protein